MSTTSDGRRAETVAAEYLESSGYKILARNWRTRWCEIDIVAEKAGVVSFVEVKYRQSARQGSGMEYITAAKLRQMGFAAQFWVAEHRYDGEHQLAAIEVTGESFRVSEFIESIA